MISPNSGQKKRLISGVKPTGRPHIGNYFGAMKQFVDLQSEYETFVFIADLHALNFIQNKEEMLQLSHDLVLDYLGIGLDPKNIVLFKQSAVPAHTQLTWIFDTLITVPFMMRAHAYKDAVAKDIEPSMGLFNYPVLMAADILMYNADVVPVGKDQKQHIEYARDIAGKFNNQYQELFKLPKELILEEVETVPGTDGQKMSKSYGNTIPLFGTDDEITKAVMSIATDSRDKDEEKNPDDMVLYQIHKLFNPSPELKAQYTQGLGYGDAKKMLIADIIAFVTPMRERRKIYENDPELVRTILLDGAMKANEIAMKKLTSVYEAVGLTE
ncbi:MAG: tryptophan--tRNA ligase [Candidatus Pacebacteria bacterium]|nr:tryptophan--tRNA ligase [Candidatus Paceibacterota bacterium]MBP9821759.1 tryptophan--tRNA ligase [Candidatus Paceibacterota bacterium]